MLDMENYEEFCKLFKGKEEENSIFVGEMTHFMQDGSARKSISLTSKFTNTEEDIIIVFEEQLIEWSQKGLEEKKQKYIDELHKKGFTVYRGVWRAF